MDYDNYVLENKDMLEKYCLLLESKFLDKRKEPISPKYFEDLEIWVNKAEGEENYKRSYFYSYMLDNWDNLNNKIYNSIPSNIISSINSEIKQDLKKFELEKDQEKSDILFLETKTKMDIFHDNLKELLKSKGL